MATTFHGKGVFPDDHPNALGAVGFMRHDYANFGFDEADVIVAVGYELQEFDPVKINPDGDKRIVHLSRFPAEVDSHYAVEVGVQADIGRTLDAAGRGRRPPLRRRTRRATRIRDLLADELASGRHDDRFPLKPQRIVADTRAALGRDDIVLADTGAVKMWMARLYPTYEPNTCLISNGLSTMAFALPGAIGAKLAAPDRRVLAAVGDGSFLMHSQEIETALRERVPMTVLVWVDDAYGLIEWKMDLELGAAPRPSGSPTRTSSPTPRASAPRATRCGRPPTWCPRCARPSPPTPCRSSPARSTTREPPPDRQPRGAERPLLTDRGARVRRGPPAAWGGVRCWAP